MQVLVELFDKEPMKNVLAACALRPQQVVFLCDERDAHLVKEAAVLRLFKRRKLKTEPRFFYFSATGPAAVTAALEAIIRQYPGCVFDFTGGRDLLLLMAGACFERMQLPGFYIDLPAGRFINLRGCQALEARFRLPVFSAEDIFAMGGATLQGHGHFSMAEAPEGFGQDIMAAFKLVMQNPKAWGSFVHWLQVFCMGTSGSTLFVKGPRLVRGGNGMERANVTLLRHLRAAGFLTRLEVGKSSISFQFKSALHRKCLMIEGVWLELFCYEVASRSGLFHDARTSIVVDWAGVEGGADSTKNEVDVFLLRGLVPVFVSCKMSVPSALALSEIRLLSGKFGGGLSRAVVLTAAAFGEEHRALRHRAAEMDVVLLDRTHCTRDALQAALLAVAGPPNNDAKGEIP